MSRTPGLLPVYAKRYGVTTRVVQGIGVERMTAMTELGRELIICVGRNRVSDTQMAQSIDRLRAERREWRKKRKVEA